MNFFIKNLGCKFNAYEANKLSEVLINNGFKASEALDANFIIINTCSVTQVADKKTRQTIRSYKKNNDKAVIVAIGCSVDSNYDELKDFTDILIKNDEKDNIINILNDYIKNKNIEFDKNIDVEDSINNETKIQNRIRAFIGIQNGCNQFCTYCIIPHLRGRIRSLNEDEILDYIKKLVKDGIKEIVFTGIHISSYSLNENESYEKEECRDKARKNLISLLKKTAEIPEVKRIRLGSLECRLINKYFIDEINSRELKYKFCPNFCLSLQSGSDTILKSMNRHYTHKEFEDVVNLIRNNIENSLITTDIIVGFPGESDKEYNETLDFVKSIKFYNPNIFPFSKRKGTKAFDFKNQISNNIKHNRVKELIDISNEINSAYNTSILNEVKEVLVEEKKFIDNKFIFTGYTKEYMYVNIIGRKDEDIKYFDSTDDYIGKILNVRIISAENEIKAIIED